MPREYAPERIVCLQPSASVVLANIGCIEKIVACTKYCVEMCPELADREIVGDSWSARGGEFAGLRADLVIASVPYQEKSVVEILKAGVRFLGLAPHSLEDIYKDIAAIAGIVGSLERGQAEVSQMKSRIDEVRTRVGGLARHRVFCEEWGKPLIASQRWVAELIEAAGGDPIGVPGARIDAEDVAAEDPDVLVAAWCGAGDRVPLEKIVRDRNWGGLRAVRERRVYCIRDEYLNTPAPTLLSGLDALAAAIHPGHFSQPAGLKRITLPGVETGLRV